MLWGMSSRKGQVEVYRIIGSAWFWALSTVKICRGNVIQTGQLRPSLCRPRPAQLSSLEPACEQQRQDTLVAFSRSV
ncbi:uncharacterized protein LY89DRAFT_100775 [Mollisia scopiformis]|uniref:Uncharacterized protein n=1 Tax=Mollisia scopiformis TaxID=149040 RepID=A0A194X734_MOLSC|nr:uncharacterized protein LY89DRAFT_100775 [Mollisia scopiformis]KUJ15986.1 hypothetical protein LY89DRAFT_100775 [Mollisia scopiformis]